MRKEEAGVLDRAERDQVVLPGSQEESLNEAVVTVSQPFPWQWWPGVCAVLAGLYVALPYGRLASVVYVLASLVAALAVGFAAYRRRPLIQPTAWKLIATALGLAAFGHGIWYWLDLQGLEPFPSVADVFYLTVYPLFGVALHKLGRQKVRSAGAINDALIGGISSAVLGWALLIVPYLSDSNLSLMQLLVSAAYPVADLVLLPLVLYLVFLQRTRARANLLLLSGMLAYLFADLLYAHGTLVGWYAPGGFTDGLWLLSYALFVAAAWHPSAAVETYTPPSSTELSQRRIFVLGFAAILVPMVTLFQGETDMQTARIAALASILLFLLVMRRMAGLLRETQQQAELLQTLSNTDPLTGAANRRELSTELAQEMARSERTSSPLSLAFLDLDHFKNFNDTYGHSAGDKFLQELVISWKTVIRPSDVLARFGGEEFVAVLPDTDLDQARQMLQRLRQIVPHGQTCSVGLARFQPGETADSLIRRADKALYEAKNSGRDQIVCEVGPEPAAG